MSECDLDFGAGEFSCEPAELTELNLTICGETRAWFSRPTWTTERPTVPGWYWVRGSSGSVAIEFVKFPPLYPSWEHQEFAGPIPEPSPAPPRDETGREAVQSG